ncbi:hypothetical protein Tco_0104780 [Tanacetum coccineum]
MLEPVLISDSLNSATGGNLLERSTQDVLTIIENKSKGNTFPEYQDNIQGYVAFRLAVTTFQGNSGDRLIRNTVANPKGELKAITTRSGLVLDGPTIPMPPPFINPEDERVEETLRDRVHVVDFVIVDYESDLRVPLILVNDDIFDPEEDIIENLLNLDKTKDLPLYHDNQLSGNPTPISEPETKSSSSPTLTSIEESDLILENSKLTIAVIHLH